MAGTLPTELSSFTALQFLLLEEGLLTGSIPSELGSLTLLEQIDLNFNALKGTIPLEIYSLTNLRQLDLNDNELTGTIPTQMAQLVSLNFFQLEQNRMVGTLPSEMGALTQLGTSNSLVTQKSEWLTSHIRLLFRGCYFAIQPILRYNAPPGLRQPSQSAGSPDHRLFGGAGPTFSALCGLSMLYTVLLGLRYRSVHSSYNDHGMTTNKIYNLIRVTNV